MAVLRKYGVEGLRMDRVARAAEVAIGTLYNYVKDKDALIFNVVDTLCQPYR